MSLIEKPFVFVRHGETFHNRARMIAGSQDVVLTEKGKQQALDAGLLLVHWQGKIVASSSQWRARQTAMLALPGQDVVAFDALRERCWGPLEQGPVMHPMPYLDAPEGAEPWNAFVERIETTLNDLLLHYEVPVIFAHSGVFRAIRFLTLGHHEGPGIPNATPVMAMPPDTGNQDWRLVVVDQAEDLIVNSVVSSLGP